jgi:hypothetical protein
LVIGACIAAGCSGRDAPDADAGSIQIVPNLFVRAVLAPPEIGPGTGPCVYTPDPTLPTLSSGTLDLALAGTYKAAILIGNSTTASVGIDTGRVVISGVDVTVTDASGAKVGAFHDDASGFVDGAFSVGDLDAASDLQPAYGIVTATLLDMPTVSRLQAPAQIVVQLTLIAENAEGAPVTSLPFTFPIDVCDGCLVSFPPNSVDPSQPVPNCAAPLPIGGIVAPCVLGQDQVADCRLCQGQSACTPH